MSSKQRCLKKRIWEYKRAIKKGYNSNDEEANFHKKEQSLHIFIYM